jgi:hypothetical protein
VEIFKAESSSWDCKYSSKWWRPAKKWT